MEPNTLCTRLGSYKHVYGEVEYYTNNTDGTNPLPSFGQIYNYESPNQNGGMEQLWRTLPTTAVPETIICPNVYQTKNMSLVVVNTTPLTINRTATPTALGTVWEMIDGYSYQPICYIANVTQTEYRSGQANALGQLTAITTGATGTPVYGLDGSILRYNIVNLGSTLSSQLLYAGLEYLGRNHDCDKLWNKLLAV